VKHTFESQHSLSLTVKGKAIPVTGRAGPQGFETSRLPYFLNNRLTDGSEVVSFIFNLCGGTLGTAATTGLLYQPRMIGDCDCG
jgi:hypothetical protein